MYKRYMMILLSVIMLMITVSTNYAAEVKDVTVRQRWPWSRKVDIEYILNCELGYEYDVQVKAYNGLQELELPDASLSGDLWRVKDGAYRIVWDPTLTDYKNQGVLNNFKVELFISRVPLYMIVDLTKTKDDPEQVCYIYESELTNGVYNTSWVRDPVTNRGSVVRSVVWTGVTEDNVYRTDKMVFRRIKAGSFGMGSDEAHVVLDKDFYMGVFQVTQKQWLHLMGTDNVAYMSGSPSSIYRPMDSVSYNLIRGTDLGKNWPGEDGKGDYRVDSSSFAGKLREMTGMDGFDLPTEAQWEYAGRAGTTTYYNDGEASAPTDGVSNDKYTSNLFLNVLGRYRYNGGYLNGGQTAPDPTCEPEDGGSASVGKYNPNAWGIYDIHGNIYEWCLDWGGGTTGGVNPVGALEGTQRVLRGSMWDSKAVLCNLNYPAAPRDPNSTSYVCGFRMVMILPLK